MVAGCAALPAAPPAMLAVAFKGATAASMICLMAAVLSFPYFCLTGLLLPQSRNPSRAFVQAHSLRKQVTSSHSTRSTKNHPCPRPDDSTSSLRK